MLYIKLLRFKDTMLYFFKSSVSVLGEHLSHVSVARSQQVLDLLLCERFTNLFDFVFELCLVNFVEWILMQEFSDLYLYGLLEKRLMNRDSTYQKCSMALIAGVPGTMK